MRKTLRPYFPLFLLPTLLAFVMAFIIPFVMGVGLSFTSFTTVDSARFVGFFFVIVIPCLNLIPVFNVSARKHSHSAWV